MSLKVVFLENGIKTESKSKKVNEPKLEWFMDELKKYTEVDTKENYIKLYVGRTVIKTKYLTPENILELFRKWLNYSQK